MDETMIPILLESTTEQRLNRLDRQALIAADITDSDLRREQLDNTLAAVTAVLGEQDGEQLRSRAVAITADLDIEQQKRVQELKRAHLKERETQLNELAERQIAEKATSTEPIKLKRMHAVETTELYHQLELEQEAAVQALKAEYEAKKAAALFELQKTFVGELEAAGKLDADKADCLIAEMNHASTQVTSWFDEERARRKAQLDHRYNIRKSLVLQKDLNDAQYKETVETLLKHQLDMIADMKNRGVITESEAFQMSANARKRFEKIDNRLANERIKREQKLKRDVAFERKRKIAEMKQQQQNDMKQLNNRIRNSGMDTLEIIRERHLLLNKQREQLMALEGEIDQSTAERLDTLHKRLIDELRVKMDEDKKKLAQKSGSTNEVLQNQNSQTETIEADHRKAKAELVNKQKEVNIARKRELDARADREVKEQKELREAKALIYQTLMNQQPAMSVTDRERFLKEQRKNLAHLENGLAINRVVHAQILANKLAQRRQTLLNKLARRKNSQKRKSDVEDDEEDERLKALQEPTLSPEQERNLYEAVFERRHKLLRDAENTLARHLAQFEYTRMRQLGYLKAQDDALRGLTSCMVDDLVDRGVLTNPDCKRILADHNADRQRLGLTLADQRERQQKKLREQLMERAARRQRTLAAEQRKRMERATKKSYQSEVARTIAEMQLVTEQTGERELLNQQLDTEVEQGLADDAMVFEERAEMQLQQQETDFVRQLVEQSDFRPDEISRVIRMVLPEKSQAEVEEMTSRLCVQSSSAPLSRHSSSGRLARKYEAAEESREFLQKRLPSARRNGRKS
uniref:Uncharacterized protein n=1 Tax=Plectus sambesii TaxID=2011161 RepID=A0A914X9P5_9BILA